MKSLTANVSMLSVVGVRSMGGALVEDVFHEEQKKCSTPATNCFHSKINRTEVIEYNKTSALVDVGTREKIFKT